MEILNFVANWSDEKQQMIVELNHGYQRYIEKMSRQRWEEFISDIDKQPLVFGGLEIKFKGNQESIRQTKEGIKKYLNRVNYAFQKTGQTKFLAVD